MIPRSRGKIKRRGRRTYQHFIAWYARRECSRRGYWLILLATISVKPAENKVAFLSISRDFLCGQSNLGTKSKINAVYAYGQKDGKNKGIGSMEEVVGNIVRGNPFIML